MSDENEKIIVNEPENITREINLDELYDGVINNTVVIDPLTKDEVLLKQKKSNFKIILVIIIIAILLLLYYVNNKMEKNLTIKDNNKTTNNKVISTTKINNLKGSLNCTYSSKSDSDSQNVSFIANYENNKILDSTFDYVVISLSESASDVVKNLIEQYEEFYINNASVSGNNISFEKNDKGFTFDVKTDYSVSLFNSISIIEGKTVLYAKPIIDDTADNLKSTYENKGFTCNLVESKDDNNE